LGTKFLLFLIETNQLSSVSVSICKALLAKEEVRGNIRLKYLASWVPSGVLLSNSFLGFDPGKNRFDRAKYRVFVFIILTVLFLLDFEVALNLSICRLLLALSRPPWPALPVSLQ
jgi:hypothetical protein